MGKITKRVKDIYESDKILSEKITGLVYYARILGFNEHNFDILSMKSRNTRGKKI